MDKDCLMLQLKEAIKSNKEEIKGFFKSSSFGKLDNAMAIVKSQLAEKSRTAKLWILYLQYVANLKQFIFAERTSDWFLHIEATKNMLNLFASSGHINYAKSARFYVQKMQRISKNCKEFPWLYQEFQDGFYAVRRSNRHCSGLWSDLTIEQMLMRSIKTCGGLTRGRGMTECSAYVDTNFAHLCVST